MELLSPSNGAGVNTYTTVQVDFLEKIRKSGTEEALAWLSSVKNGQECSAPKSLVFSWQSSHSKEYVLELAESPDFTDAYSVVTTDTSFEITNFKVNTTYYWRVNHSQSFSFTTMPNEYRFIYVDGLLNVRDLGGIGIKQGLLYRGSDVEGEYQITPKGVDTFCRQLQIRTELQLRKEVPDRAGAASFDTNVRYVRLPYRPYKECFLEEHRRGICRIMEFLAEKENYPIYFHCLGGADRTGMIALFLRSLAGETDEQIFTDYELTSLSMYAGGLAEGAAANGFRSRNSGYFVEFLQLLDSYAPGERLAVKVPLFLLDCGVAEETIKKVCKIIKV